MQDGEFGLENVACTECREKSLQVETRHPVRNAVMTFNSQTGFSGKWFEYEEAEGMKARDYDTFHLCCTECGTLLLTARTGAEKTAIRQIEEFVLNLHRKQALAGS